MPWQHSCHGMYKSLLQHGGLEWNYRKMKFPSNLNCDRKIVSKIILKWFPVLTHWGRVTHICVSTLTIIGSDNGLSPDRRQAINWTNAGLLLIRPLGTNFSEIVIEIRPFLFKKMRLKVSPAKRRPFCLGLNVLTYWGLVMPYGIGDLDQHWSR